MSTSSAVRTAWNTYIWQDGTVQGITPNSFLFDVSLHSAFEVAQLLHQTRVNFFTCRVQRTTRYDQVGGVGASYTFEVRVDYYLQQTDNAESTYNSVVDRLETVDALVRTSLGKTWAATVDYFDGGRPVPVTEVTIDGCACWRGGFVYTAFKTT